MIVALLKPVAVSLFAVSVAIAILSWSGSREYPTVENSIFSEPPAIPASSRALHFAPSFAGVGSPLGQWRR